MAASSKGTRLGTGKLAEWNLVSTGGTRLEHWRDRARALEGPG